MTLRLAIVFAFVAALWGASAGAATLRLDRDVTPVRQEIRLRLDPRADRYSGSVRITLEVARPVSQFRFHAADLTIESLQLDADARTTHRVDAENTVLVSMAVPLPPGRHVLSIDYVAPYNRQSVGLYRVVKGSEPYLFTQFEAIDARRAFPCWDEPGFKLPYQLTVEIPAGFDAVSNAPVLNETVAGDWKTIAFAPTKPLPAYLIALAVGRFDYVPVATPGLATRIVTPKGQGALAQLTAGVVPPVLAALERYFASPYPFEKLDLIAVPEFWPGGMENPGAILFRDGILLAEPSQTTPSQRRNLARVTAHELAHMWFGDMVTMAWWDDLWLNESFADWMGDRIAAEVFPDLGGALTKRQTIQQAMIADANPSIEPIRNRDTTPEGAMRNVGIQYDKGSAVLEMVEQWIGPERFRAAILDHLKANAWSNATAAQFFAALGRHASADVTAAMESFVDQPGLPVVRVEWSNASPPRIRLTQSRYLAAGSTASPQRWRIPVTLLYSDGVQRRKATVLLAAPETTLDLEGERIEWLYPHAGASGYYRWEAPLPAMRQVGDRAVEILSPAERLGFLGNAAALLAAGRIPADEYLGIVQRFGADPHPQVIQAVIAALTQLRTAFFVPDTRAGFAAFVRRTLGPALRRIGFAPRPGEPEIETILRPALLTWLAGAGEDAEAGAFARAQAARYLQDREAIDASLVLPSLSIAARDGDAALFEEIRRRFEAARTPVERYRYLNVLGEFRRAELRERALAYALSGPLRVPEILVIPRTGIESAEDRERTFRWATANYDAIAKRIAPQFLAWMPYLASGCEPDRLRDAAAFFATRKSEGTELSLARVGEQVKACTTLREREGARVSAYFTGGG